MKQLIKGLRLLRVSKGAKILLQYRVAASVEHWSALRGLGCRTVVDIGANRGQFALALRGLYPKAMIYSFEPLVGPGRIFQRVFSGDKRVKLFPVAIGSERGATKIHLSARDDSSSLLPIGLEQHRIFPGTEEVGTMDVAVTLLEDQLDESDIVKPALLKLDVQGYELEALRGCSSLLRCFDYIYCECSFIPLYEGQALADEVIAWLRKSGFVLRGVYNMSYDKKGKAVQADFMFEKR